MMNQTQLVRSAINLFIVVAVGVSLFQQIMNLNSQPSAAPVPTVTTTEGETIPLEPTGPVIQGIRILSSDRYNQPIKEILAKNRMNVEISSYTFEGNLYWMNMVFNWGHIVLIYVLLGKYKTETDDQAKKKIMIGGALAVLAWFYFSAQLKPQAVAIEVHGSKVYDRDYFNENEIVEILQEQQFAVDDLNEAAAKPRGTQKIDAWTEQQQRQQQGRAQPQQQVIEAEEIF